MIFLLLIVCSYLGYLFKNELEDLEMSNAGGDLRPDGQYFQNPFGNRSAGNSGGAQPSPYLYNGGGTGLSSNNQPRGQ